MDVTDEEMKRVFARLRPVCVTLTQDPSRDNVRTLVSVLDRVTDGQLALLQDYILFPLRLLIKQTTNKSTELLIDVVKCLHQILSRCPVTRVDAFHDLFNSLSLLISSPDARVSEVPEELKLAVVECLTALLSGAPVPVRHALYHLTFLPSLGHAVSLLLALLTSETFRRLQTAAARCILQLLHVHNEDRDARVKLGDTFSSFLPGITMAMTRVVTGDIKQGHAVTTAALKVWTETVTVVMGDDSLSRKVPDTNRAPSGLPLDVEAKFADLRVTRSDDWVKATADKLQILVNKMSTLVTHPSWHVRLALVDWAQRLLTQCSSSMPAASQNGLDVLVQLSADEYDTVASRGRAALEEVQTRMEADGSLRLLVVLEENLHDLATRLPRLMHSTDDEKKLSTLILFSGYLKLLGPRVRCLLLSASHLQRVSTALLQVLEFDTSHLELVQEAHTGFQLSIGSSHFTGAAPRFYFKHFTDERIHKQVVSVCRMLGRHGDLDLLIDHFLEVTHQGPTYRKQAFYIINELVLGLKDDEKFTEPQNEDVIRVIECLIEEYLSPENWELDTATQSDAITQSKISADLRIVPMNQRPYTLQARTSNILRICILLEGISSFAQVLGEGFRPHLVDVIYPLMERLGDNMAAIHSTAQRVSQEVAAACGYRDVHGMVCANSDYLVNAISLRLRHIERYPYSPCVLQSVLKHSTSSVLPLFEDIVQEVLTVLDDHYDTRAAVFMQVLYTLTAAIRLWYPGTTAAQNSEEEDGPPPTKITRLCKNTQTQESLKHKTQNVNENSLAEFLLEYEKLKETADGEMDAEDSGIDSQEVTSEQADCGIAEDAEEDRVVPQHIHVIKQVLERCCHLLSSPDARLRLLVLRTVSEGCLAIQDEQNELLPLAHKLWAPFVQRFRDEEPLVALQAVQTLETIGQTTGDFLRRRVVEEVLPPMADFLTKQARVSVCGGSQYRYTVLSKLQVAVLHTVTTTTQQVDLKGCLLYRVARACLPYLSARQPTHLQQVALQAFQRFVEVDADAVWLLLIEEYSPTPLVPPDARYANHKVGSCKKSEYSENIQTLLTQMEL